MTHKEIRNIPKDWTVIYARMVVDYRPQKPDPNRVCITAGGKYNKIPRKANYTDCGPDHIKHNVEQCVKHKERKVHVH